MEEVEITSLLPHRKPFLFLDRLTHIDDSIIVGNYTFSEQLAFFKGHFPSHPIVPGVILVEAMAQCGGAGLKARQQIEHNQLFFLATIDAVKFRTPVFPNTQVEFHIETIKISSRMISQKGKAFIATENSPESTAKLVAEAQWKCFISTSNT